MSQVLQAFFGTHCSMSLFHVVCKRLLVACLAISFLMTAGCGGCFRSAEKDDKAKNKKPKDNFEAQTPVILPGYYPMDPEEREKLEKEAKEDEQKRKQLNNMDPAFRNNRIKRGHWASVDFLAIANNFDADGSFETFAFRASKPQLVEGADYFVATKRPFTLTKGEWKKLETSVFVPRAERESNTTSIRYRLGNGGSLSMIERAEPINVMDAYQHHVVVLSNRFDRYGYLKFLDCIKLPGGSVTSNEAPQFYSIIPKLKGDPVPLPSNSMNWTTIAYIIWDDLDPNELSIEQQNAMLDWLHFGGQIIFSGPDCLDMMQSSFLADWLPAKFEQTAALASDDIKELNTHWAVPEKKTGGARTLQLPAGQPLSVIRFRPHVDAQFIENASEVAVERRIGRGRVVATAFSLVNRQITSWRSFASFFHNALMRKPYREFSETSYGDVSFRYDNDGATVFDPLTNSTLRYISRDLGSSEATATESPRVRKKRSEDAQIIQSRSLRSGNYDDSQTVDAFLLPSSETSRNKDDHFHYGGFDSTEQSGVAGWNDQSGIARAARKTLKRAARITPPDSDFVLRMLGLYLLILVPINWIIFRVIGKVEWAWIAAPIISIVGAVAVVRYASLDIGFVRSVTHVGVLELHGDYPRGHLTEYSALYTSLSTRYRIELDNNSGQAIPLANRDTGLYSRGESFQKVTLNRSAFSELDNFLVRSNSTGLLHTELMLDVGGTFSLQTGTDEESKWVVANGTFCNLEDCGIIRRIGKNDYEVAWIGEFKAGTQSPELRFARVKDGSEGLIETWQKSSQMSGTFDLASRVWDEIGKHPDETVLPDADNALAKSELLADRWSRIEGPLRKRMQDTGTMSVSRELLSEILFELSSENELGVSEILGTLLRNLQLGKDEVRLIAQTKQKPDQTKFVPEATQIRQNLLVVAHLKHCRLPHCRRDVNAISDFTTGPSNIDQEEYEEFIKKLDDFRVRQQERLEQSEQGESENGDDSKP